MWQEYVWLVSGQKLTICWEANENHENESQNTFFPEYLEVDIQNTKCQLLNHGAQTHVLLFSLPNICTTELENSSYQHLTVLDLKMYLLSHNDTHHSFLVIKLN
jgi:hypothetical protein